MLLSVEDATVWALYYKEKFGKARWVSISEIKSYAKEVSKLCKDMFDFDVEFKFTKTEMKKFVESHGADIKYRDRDQTIRMKTFATTKWLIADATSKRPVVFELDRALVDSQIGRRLFAQDQRERE